MYNSMIEAIKEESIQLLFRMNLEQIVAETENQDDSYVDADIQQAEQEEDEHSGIVGPAPMSHADGEVP
ncbi:hypothetical protein QP636_15095, partial [Enterococcus faecalis]